MKTRFIFGMIMLLIAVPTLLFAPAMLFVIILSFVGLLATRELIKATKKVPFIAALVMYISVIGSLIYAYNYGFVDSTFIYILFIIHALIPILIKNIQRYSFINASTLFFMNLYVVLGFSALVAFKTYFELEYILYPIIIAIACDTFGYFGGMILGKNKLIEEISAKKTIEGAVVASIFSIIISMLFLSKFMNFELSTMIIISCVMTGLSQFGDLFASVIKRTYEIKDYSNLIPGHGGVLDRLDSILFNFIVFSVVLSLV